MKIAGNGSTSRLYQKLVVRGEDRLQRGRLVFGHGASTAARIGIYVVAAQGVDLDKVETAHRPRRCTSCARAGLTADELERAKKAFIAEFVYEIRQPERAGPALRRRAAARLDDRADQRLAGGHRQGDGRATSSRVAAKYLDIRRSVTGTLIPTPPEPESAAALKPAANEESEGGRHDARRGDNASSACGPERRCSPLSSPCGAFYSQSAGHEAMKIQEVKSPGGITAWLVEEHACR